MYVILGCHLKCNFCLMVKSVILLYSDNPAHEIYLTYLNLFNLIITKASGDIYAL